MLPGCYTFDSFVLKLLLHVYMVIYVYMVGEGLWNSPPGVAHCRCQILEIYVSHVNWCIANKEAVRVVLVKSLWLSILYKWPLDCAPIFTYALKLSFCIIYVPILHVVFVKGKDIQGYQTETYHIYMCLC